jgi:hypothetical protein
MTVAAIGNGSAFRRGRDFAAWVGVVPRQYSTGGKQKLYGISKRGNIYLRRMLIHGARAVLFRVKYDTGGFGQWVHRLAQRAPSNKVVVAIANKLARIAWAVLLAIASVRIFCAAESCGALPMQPGQRWSCLDRCRWTRCSCDDHLI